MAKRWIGDALVRVRYSKKNDSYGGSVTVRSLGVTWTFKNLPVSDRALVSSCGKMVGRESDEAFDAVAEVAAILGSALQEKDEDDEKEIVRAAAIEEATNIATDECGNYAVRRSR